MNEIDRTYTTEDETHTIYYFYSVVIVVDLLLLLLLLLLLDYIDIFSVVDFRIVLYSFS